MSRRTDGTRPQPGRIYSLTALARTGSWRAADAGPADAVRDARMAEIAARDRAIQAAHYAAEGIGADDGQRAAIMGHDMVDRSPADICAAAGLPFADDATADSILRAWRAEAERSYVLTRDAMRRARVTDADIDAMRTGGGE